MANTIRIKRTTTSNRPSSLENAEMALIEGSQILVVGIGTGGANGSASSIIDIGGSGAFVNLTETQNISGAKTFTSTVALGGSATATTQTPGDNSTKVATTGYVSWCWQRIGDKRRSLAPGDIHGLWFPCHNERHSHGHTCHTDCCLCIRWAYYRWRSDADVSCDRSDRRSDADSSKDFRFRHASENIAARSDGRTDSERVSELAKDYEPT